MARQNSAAYIGDCYATARSSTLQTTTYLRKAANALCRQSNEHYRHIRPALARHPTGDIHTQACAYGATKIYAN